MCNSCSAMQSLDKVFHLALEHDSPHVSIQFPLNVRASFSCTEYLVVCRLTCMCSSFLFISCVGRSVPSVVPCTKRTKRDSLSLLSRYRAYMYYIVSSSHSPHFSLSPFPSLTTQEIHLTIKGKGEGRGEMGLVPRLVMLAGLT